MAIYPRPRDVTEAYQRQKGDPALGRQQSGKVVGGNWDLHRSDVDTNTKLVSCRMRWLEGADWEETPIYAYMMAEIRDGRVTNGCRTREDVDERYRRLDAIFATVRAEGRLRDMSELPEYFRRAHGATLIHVARDGTCLRSGGGAHRFAIARILDLPEMPAQLGAIHPDAIRDGHLARLRRSRFAATG